MEVQEWTKVQFLNLYTSQHRRKSKSNSKIKMMEWKKVQFLNLYTNQHRRKSKINNQTKMLEECDPHILNLYTSQHKRRSKSNNHMVKWNVHLPRVYINLHNLLRMRNKRRMTNFQFGQMAKFHIRSINQLNMMRKYLSLYNSL